MDLQIEQVIDLFQVNVFAVMRLCQLFIPLLRHSPCGRIVQIGSVTRSLPVVWQGAYNASKAALSQYSKTLRLVRGNIRFVFGQFVILIGYFIGVEAIWDRGDRNCYGVCPQHH